MTTMSPDSKIIIVIIRKKYFKVTGFFFAISRDNDVEFIIKIRNMSQQHVRFLTRWNRNPSPLYP